MDTEPKIVGRENRPHMNALVHRTFWVGTARSDAIAVDDAIASNVVREARHFAGGRLVGRSEAHCHATSRRWKRCWKALEDTPRCRRGISNERSRSTRRRSAPPPVTPIRAERSSRLGSRASLSTQRRIRTAAATRKWDLGQGRRRCRTRAPRSRRHLRGVRHARAQDGRRDRDHTRREGGLVQGHRGQHHRPHPVKYVAPETTPAQRTYHSLFPYSVEVRAVSQFHQIGAKPGDWGGHATLFIDGGQGLLRRAPSSIYAALTGASSQRRCTNHFRRRVPDLGGALLPGRTLAACRLHGVRVGRPRRRYGSDDELETLCTDDAHRSSLRDIGLRRGPR